MRLGLGLGLRKPRGEAAPATDIPVALTAPSISGTPTVGETLTGHPGTYDQPVSSRAYRWLADDVAIDGATAATYLLTETEEGAVITFEEVASNSFGAGDANVSAGTDEVAAAEVPETAPVIDTAPTISGTPTVGETLTATEGTYTGTVTSRAYRWLADDVAISGATSLTYDLTEDEIGAVITFEEVATNSAGSSDANLSDPTEAVAAAEEEDETEYFIYSTDLATDCDDMAALGIIAQALREDANKVLIATVSDSPGPHAAPGLRTTLNEYDLTSVPVGAYDGDTGPTDSHYALALTQEFDSGNQAGETRDDYPSASTVMRQALDALPAGKKAVIMAVGMMSAVHEFVTSAAGEDGIAASGAELYLDRVSLVVSQGSNYVNGTPRYNWEQNTTASQYLINNAASLGVPWVVMPADEGDDVKVRPDPSWSAALSPIKRAYDLSDIQLDSNNRRNAWDLMAVYYALFPDNAMWGWHVQNVETTYSGGSVTRDTGSPGVFSWLNPTVSKAAVATELEAYLATLTQPDRTPTTISDLEATVLSDTQVALAFTPGLYADSYEYRIDGGSWTAIATGGATLSGLTAETEYDFEVRGVNALQNGAASNVETVTTEAYDGGATGWLDAPMSGALVEAGNSATSITLTEPDALAAEMAAHPTDVFVHVAVVSYRGNSPYTIPGDWTLVGTQISADGNATYNTSASANGGFVAVCERGGSAPTLTFDRGAGTGLTVGVILTYRHRGAGTFSLVDGSSEQAATSVTGMSTPELTTDAANTLIVAGFMGARNTTMGTYDAATDPATASPAAGASSPDTTTPPTAGAWIERFEGGTATPPRAMVGLADAIKETAGATGAITGIIGNNSRSIIAAGALKVVV